MAISEFQTTRRVEFADTDMGGIVHFSRFFVFMETAEHEFLRSLGLDVHHVDGGHEVGWPRLSASCEYKSPARLGDTLAIHLSVVRKGTTSMTYGFEMRSGERLVARGRVTSVRCRIGGKTLEPVPIPAAMAAQVGEAVRVEEGD